jgi:hypothetical protein
MMTSSGDVLDVNRPRSVRQTRSSSEEKRIESGSSACPLSELPLSRGTHGNTHLLPLDNALLFPMMDQFGSCLTHRLSITSTTRHVTGLSSGRDKEAGMDQNQHSEWRVSIHAPKDSLTIRVLSAARWCLSLTLCSLADSRRSAPAQRLRWSGNVVNTAAQGQQRLPP